MLDPAQNLKWEKIRKNPKAGEENRKQKEPKNIGQETLAFAKWIKPLQSQGKHLQLSGHEEF